MESSGLIWRQQVHNIVVNLDPGEQKNLLDLFGCSELQELIDALKSNYPMIDAEKIEPTICLELANMAGFQPPTKGSLSPEDYSIFLSDILKYSNRAGFEQGPGHYKEPHSRGPNHDRESYSKT